MDIVRAKPWLKTEPFEAAGLSSSSSGAFDGGRFGLTRRGASVVSCALAHKVIERPMRTSFWSIEDKLGRFRRIYQYDSPSFFWRVLN
jgi:hypothetical protein